MMPALNNQTKKSCFDWRWKFVGHVNFAVSGVAAENLIIINAKALLLVTPLPEYNIQMAE